MEETTNNDNLNNYRSVQITGMEPEFFNAAMDGKIDAFKRMEPEQIESILTLNKNTVLHIHLTNFTDKVSETFVEEILLMCPKLVLKTNVKDETILHVAARYGHHKIVKNLIECAKVCSKDIIEVGAEKTLVREKNDKKDTALHEAVRYGHEEIVDVLIKEEPDHSHFGKNIDDETPLYIAVERQYWKVVDTLLDNSSSPQYDGPKGRTALHAAVLHGDTEIVSKLLTRYSSIATQADEIGWVPLHLAALCRNTEVVELLVRENRSTAYMRDNKGRTALHFAAFSGDSFAMGHILKYCPDCCELVDKKGNNALHYTTLQEGNPSFEVLEGIMKVAPLISNMCNEKDDDGNTPLHLLARRASECQSYCKHDLLQPQLPRVDKMAFNKYGQTVIDVAIDHVPEDLSDENKMLRRLQDIGARARGLVLDKHLKEKKQEKMEQDKIHDDLNIVIQKEEEDKKRDQDYSNAVDDKTRKGTGDEAEEQDKKCDQDYSKTADDKTRKDTGDKAKEQDKKDDQDYYGRVSTTVSVVATLIATVTFTAAFTLPGGLFQDGEHKGSPILKNNVAFRAFLITDSLSFTLSASAVISLYWSSIYKIKHMVLRSVYLTAYAMGCMVIAFMTGIYAVLGLSKVLGLIIVLIVVSCYFVNALLITRAMVRAKGTTNILPELSRNL